MLVLMPITDAQVPALLQRVTGGLDAYLEVGRAASTGCADNEVWCPAEGRVGVTDANVMCVGGVGGGMYGLLACQVGLVSSKPLLCRGCVCVCARGGGGCEEGGGDAWTAASGTSLVCSVASHTQLHQAR
jgi:hypothetical protein